MAGARVTRKTRGAVCAALLTVSLVASGCGSRLSTEEILAQNQIGGATLAGGQLVDPVTGEVLSAEAPTTDVTFGTGPSQTGSGAGPAVGAEAGPAAVPAGRAPAAGESATTQGAGDTEPTVTSGRKKPIVLAQVGAFGGIGGPVSGPARDALGAWARSVNAQGGINGHPVKLLVADDGGNESKSLALVRDFVESKGAIAVVGYAGATASTVGDYATRTKLPMVGGLNRDRIWFQSPYMFPTGADVKGIYYGVAQQIKAAGITRAGTIYCNEAAVCPAANEAFLTEAKAAGVEVVYQGRVSLAQPDFTGECIQARNSGAEAIVPIGDQNTTIRFMQSCQRQSYKPQLVVPLANDAMAQVGVLDGTLAAPANVPWFLYSGSPALAEYGKAIKAYAPDLVGRSSSYATGGWVAGKLLEKALEGVSGTPTRQDVLNGLYKLRGETLGGLVPPLTFTQGKPAKEPLCTYPAQLKKGVWTSPNGGKPRCKP